MGPEALRGRLGGTWPRLEVAMPTEAVGVTMGEENAPPGQQLAPWREACLPICLGASTCHVCLITNSLASVLE